MSYLSKHGIRIFQILIGVLILLSSTVSADDDALPFDINDQQARLENQRSIPITRWPDNIPGGPTYYNEWKAGVGESGPFNITLEKTAASSGLKKDPVKFNIIVRNIVYNYIGTALDQYIIDLTNEGYDVKLFSTSGGTPSEFRSYLQEEYAEGMQGCVLIGDLPVPWFETDCWDAYTNFPIDLYYMDMDGIWEDNDSDGMFDNHYGDMGPEIWMGRLTANPLNYGGATEINLLLNYFNKIHEYRTGQRFLNNRGLAYIDDDWIPWAEEWGGNLGLAYPHRTLVSDGAETISTDYENRLADNYESVLICCHSWPGGHSFKIGDNWTGGDTYSVELPGLNPTAHFYNLFACSNSRYVEEDYMGGWYIFTDDNGLASIGSTKTGSMLYFGYFYGPFASGRTVGEAFMDWFNAVAAWGFPQEDLCWFYGMTLCGDPTLKHLEPPPVTILNAELLNGYPGVYYCDTLRADGGLPPYTWSILAGELPGGLTLDVASGEIAGMPTEMTTGALTIEVSDCGIPALTDSGDFNLVISYLCGDANGDGNINILDIIYLISFVYKGGPAPSPFGSGDVNATQTINILDITYMIAFLYQGGPELNCLY